MKLFTVLAASSLSAVLAASFDCALNDAKTACNDDTKCNFNRKQNEIKAIVTCNAKVTSRTCNADTGAYSQVPTLADVAAGPCNGAVTDTAAACTDKSVTDGIQCEATTSKVVPEVPASCTFKCDTLTETTCGDQTGCMWQAKVDAVLPTFQCKATSIYSGTACVAATTGANAEVCGKLVTGGARCCGTEVKTRGVQGKVAKCVAGTPAKKKDDSSATAAITSAFVATAAAMLM